MLMALANLDGSFTVLYLPQKRPEFFEGLNKKEEVEAYFANIFRFFELVPNLYEQWLLNPTSSLGIVRTFPWHIKDTTLIIGDAAHATVPFYGQGMNCGFEDCRILNISINMIISAHVLKIFLMKESQMETVFKNCQCIIL